MQHCSLWRVNTISAPLELHLLFHFRKLSRTNNLLWNCGRIDVRELRMLFKTDKKEQKMSDV